MGGFEGADDVRTLSMQNLEVLHSCIDIEDCLKSIQGDDGEGSWGRKRRKVLQASSTADSSITIPNVTLVIDTMGSIEVK
jgi:hypothetical protein